MPFRFFSSFRPVTYIRVTLIGRTFSVLNGVILFHMSIFVFSCLYFVADFVIISFLLSLFRFFFISRCVFSLFFVFSPGLFCLFVFSAGVILGHKDEKIQWHKLASIHKQFVGWKMLRY